MMHGATRRALPALVAIVAACATTPRVDTATEEQRIREASQQTLRAMQAKDAAAVANLYTETGLSMGPYMPVMRGRESIRASLAQMFGMPGFTLSFSPTSIEIAESGDLAYEVGTYQFGADIPTGRLNDRGKYLTVWRKVGGEWRIAADMNATDLPFEQLARMMIPQPQVAGGAVVPAAVTGSDTARHFHAREITWRDGPPSLPAGARIAVLEGDPMQPGPFTFRLRFPANYRIPPHTHPVIEHVTVISGSFSIGQGGQWSDAALKRLEPGDFAYMAPNSQHFAQAHSETVIQLHSTGPWGITYVNPADDPRNRR
jgi:uncharacterized protein (TIGR02246 family)